MKLTQTMSLEEFRDEMQVRAFKHNERSQPVREAIRFARQHSDPAFYRVAVDKVIAQEQYRHETYGPSRWQRFVDFLSGAPKDAAMTLCVIAAVLAGLSFMRSRLLEPVGDTVSDSDVDRLAERMGLYITRHAPPAAEIELPDVDAAYARQLDTRLAALENRLAERMEELRNEMRKAQSTGEPEPDMTPATPAEPQAASTVGR